MVYGAAGLEDAEAADCLILVQVLPPHRGCRHENYGLTCDEFDALRARAGDRCEICGAFSEKRALHIDHDHALGDTAVRGLVCSPCNSLLGRIDAGRRRASPDVARYLRTAWHIKHPPSAKAKGAEARAKSQLLPSNRPLYWSLGHAERARHDRAFSRLSRYTQRYGRNNPSRRLGELAREALEAGMSPSRVAMYVGRARVRRIQEEMLAGGDHDDPTPSD